VLYVGKAKNLKKRVSSYTRLNQLSARKRSLVKAAAAIKHQVLASELEALLIEAELIRLHQPEFNVLLKDDKSPIYIQIQSGAFPSIKLVRKRDLHQEKQKSDITLGPYSSAYKLRQVLKIARRIFPWCDVAQERVKSETSQPQEELKKYQKSCFYYHLDLCPGACVGLVSAKDYQENLEQLLLFLKGKKKEVLKQMEQRMKQLANDLEFEKASAIKQKMALIQDVTSEKYRLKPDLILPALHEKRSQHALDHLRRILTELGVLSRQAQLTRIEGYDVSNIFGQDAAVSMVVFNQGEPDKSQYRLFNIRNLDTPNDYQMMKQAILRRNTHPEWAAPDLIVVDGGKGQVRAAIQAQLEEKLETKNKSALIVGIEKNPDRLVVPIKQQLDGNNRLKIEYEVIQLPSDHPALHLLQQVRDESHRFAKKQHSRLRKKSGLPS
jgi:excinuclease ABC subunit C